MITMSCIKIFPFKKNPYQCNDIAPCEKKERKKKTREKEQKQTFRNRVYRNMKSHRPYIVARRHFPKAKITVLTLSTVAILVSPVSLLRALGLCFLFSVP